MIPKTPEEAIVMASELYVQVAHTDSFVSVAEHDFLGLYDQNPSYWCVEYDAFECKVTLLKREYYGMGFIIANDDSGRASRGNL